MGVMHKTHTMYSHNVCLCGKCEVAEEINMRCVCVHDGASMLAVGVAWVHHFKGG